MNLILFDTSSRSKLFPLTLTRAVADVRAGIFTIKERWEKLTGHKVFVLTEEYLQVLYEPIPEGEYLFIDATVFPGEEILAEIFRPGVAAAIADDHGLIAGKAIFNPAVTIKNLDQLFADTKPVKTVRRIGRPHQLVQFNDEVLRFDFSLIAKTSNPAALNDTVQTINPSQIFVEEGAIVNYCMLNAAAGPIYIGNKATIMEGSVVRGPFALCEGAVVKMGAKVYGATTIGPWCTAGGEIKNSIMTGYSNKAHDGYLGDSLIGEWCNLGAGTSCSNVKNTGGDIRQWSYYEEEYMVAGNKCGVVMGDHSRTAINTSVNSGTVIGVSCNVFTEWLTPKLVNNFSWGVKGEIYRFEKAMTDIANWKKFKNQDLSANEAAVLQHIYDNAVK